MIPSLRQIGRALRRTNWLLAAVTLLLIATGVCFIYSAGSQGFGEAVRPFYRKQIVWGLLGFAFMTGLAVSDYRVIGRAATALYALGLASLVLVLLVGPRVHGAARWLSVFGLRVQPSEFAKLATVVMLARHLAHPVRRPEKLSSVARAGLLAVLPFALIAMEPDLGTATVLIPVTAAMLLTAGMTFRMLLLFLAGGLAALPASWFLLGDYQRERLLTFIDPGRDPLGAGWNKIQSELAVGSGGLTGKGFLEGTQNVLGFLPRTVAPTDFIFSVIAEEAGFIGSALVLALFAVMISCGMSTALTARDRFGQILTVGLITMLFVHVFINTAMTIGLMPITGLPLPLISYGGSFMVSTMGALGLIQSVYVRRHQH